MHQIVCMKWGSLYSPEYVNRLYAMVQRNLDEPFRFVCLTDSKEGLRSEIECHPCPTVDIPHPQCNLGWRKVTLWAESVDGLQPGNALFIDLDVVITGPLKPFFEYQPEATFVVAPNWTQPGSGIGNTSVYRFKIGSHPYLLSRLLDDPQGVLATYPNSQTYISRNVEPIAFWPDSWCCSFKVHCVPKGIQRYFQEPLYPPGTRIVAFPGVPNPSDAVIGRWPAKWYKRVYKHIRPASWVQEAWRE